MKRRGVTFLVSGPRALPYERLGVARLAGGEIGPASNGDPGVAFAPVHGTAHPQVEARRETAPGPQVEEQERPLETRAQAARREHPEQAVDEAKAGGRVTEGERQTSDLNQRSYPTSRREELKNRVSPTAASSLASSSSVTTSVFRSVTIYGVWASRTAGARPMSAIARSTMWQGKIKRRSRTFMTHSVSPPSCWRAFGQYLL